MKAVVIYGPGDTINLMMGDAAGVNAFAAVNQGGEARRLHRSPLADLSTSLDPRLPATVTEFDAAYPGCEDWYA